MDEEWPEFLRRIDLEALDAVRAKDMRRLLDEMWNDPALEHRCVSVLDHAVSGERKSYDRKLIERYLRHFPIDHRSFDHLAAAAAMVARRHDWPWRERGERWSLWDKEEGPRRLSAGLAAAEEPSAVLRAVGLDQWPDSQFVIAALRQFCVAAATLRGAEAEQTGRRLIVLLADRAGTGELDGYLAYSLLAPWTQQSPSDEYRRLLMAFFVARIGDPRLQPARWATIRREVLELFPRSAIDEILGVLRRWLVQATVRQFFAIVGSTTNDPVQWAARERFWLEYLDHGLISDAWFAFGRQARQRAKSIKSDEGVGYGTIEGQGADPSHSSLILAMGDARIAEWSHNGACRFWRTGDRRAPELYKKTYWGLDLRAMNGGPEFDYIAHQGLWQAKFAKKIHQLTGIRHPRFGSGY